MARLTLAAVLLFAVVAAVCANPEPEPSWGQGEHRAALKNWAHHEKEKAGELWRKTVSPQIAQLKAKFGQLWMQKEPKIAAALKLKAGAAFNKAVEFANQLVQKKLG
ncbi:hypothetical protein ONE63_005935 [Megalurothrips usitatus]|uniref:Uncharacterized protein n=1 Tax=Megalurothrips usitatus TaxID=439358 RepID=A0AAV7XX38_9NEOP|nr:hypothetical protein ONE63_005935 [Megalurothrips usitatus]